MLKDGRTVARACRSRTRPTAELIQLMTGRTVEYAFPGARRRRRHDAATVLEVEGLGLAARSGRLASTVRAGEVVGLAGLVGSGRSEILETIYGARRATAAPCASAASGCAPGSVSAAVSAGIGLCPEERKSQGLLLDEPVYRNITLSTFARIARRGVPRRGRRARRRRASRSRRSTCARRRRPQRPDAVRRQPAEGRCSRAGCARLPGPAARRAHPRRRRRRPRRDLRPDRRLADEGAAVVVVSSEIPEVLGLADRVLVISEGRVVHEGPARHRRAPRARPRHGRKCRVSEQDVTVPAADESARVERGRKPR